MNFWRKKVSILVSAALLFTNLSLMDSSGRTFAKQALPQTTVTDSTYASTNSSNPQFAEPLPTSTPVPPKGSHEALNAQSGFTAPSPTPTPTLRKNDAHDYDPNRYLITYHSKDAKTKVKDKIIKQKGKIKKEYTKINVYNAELDENALHILKSDTEIKSIEPDYNVHSQSDDVPWGIENIHATNVQNSGLYGNGVKVAVFDTGISPHQDLSLNSGISFVEGVTSTIDDNGHGTHVAGTIAAQINQKGILGAAPGVQLYPVKVLNSNGSGSYSSIISAIDWAVDNNINIINMSFGSTSYSVALESAIKLAYDNNILIVASAGNNGVQQGDSMTYPAKFKEVIAVGAVDEQNNRASFSSAGTEMDLVAPGVNIYSTQKDGTYGIKSGTSMAAPHVAGVAALLWSKNLKLSNSTISGLLDLSALDIGDATIYGNGLVDASYALEIYDAYTKPDKSKDNSNNGKRVSKDKKNNAGSSVSASSASFSASNITSSSVTWNATFPVSGQYGDRVETWNSTDGWRDVSGTWYTTNGSYTSYGLRAGESYMGRLTWYDYGTSLWNSIDQWITTPGNSASFTASNITSSSITWNAIFPVSGQYGDRVETWNSTDGWRDVSGTWYTTNGAYTSSGLRAGNSYMGRLTWYDYGVSLWKSIDLWVTTPSPTLPAIGPLDVPSNGQVISGNSYGAGWALDGAGVNRIDVLVDNVFQVQASYGYNREDVYNAYPAYNNHYSGYSFYLNTATIPNGAHTISIRETSNNGSQTIIASKSITVDNQAVLPVASALDVPTSGQTLTGISYGAGWVLDGAGVSRVDVLVDNIVRVQATYGGQREDVYNAYPSYNNHYAGYSFYLDTTSISNGSHTISIRETANSGTQTIFGTRTVTVNNDDGNSTSTSTSIVVGNTSNANIDYSSDIDYFRFQPSSNGVYSFVTNGSTDTIVELYDNKEILFGYNDDYLGAVSSNITIELYSGQTYYVKVYHYDQSGLGAYTLQLSQIDDNVNGESIVVNSSITRIINYAGDEDIFVFTPSATQSYVIKTTGSTDTVGILSDSTNDPIADNDDTTDLNFSITKVLTANQTYFIKVKAYNPNLFNTSYTLVVQ